MQQADQICINPDGSQTYSWCTYQAIDNFSIKIQAIYMGVLMILSIIILRYLVVLTKIKYKKRLQHLFGNVFIQVFILLTFWLLFIINLYAYLKYMKQDFQYTNTYSQVTQFQQSVNQDEVVFNNIVLSALFNVFDFLCIYFLMFLMLMIPYQWINTVLLNINERKLTNDHIRITIHKFFVVLKVVRVYYKYIRVLFIPFLLSQPFLLFFTNYGCQLPTLNYTLTIGQSILILIFYIVGIFISRFLQKNRLVVISNEDYSRIKKQYIMLVFILCTRIILNFYFRISPMYNYSPKSSCSDVLYNNKIAATIFLIIAHFIMHTLTVLIIIYIYRPNLRYLQLNQSLIFQQQYDQIEYTTTGAKKVDHKNYNKDKQDLLQKILKQPSHSSSSLLYQSSFSQTKSNPSSQQGKKGRKY